MSRLFLVALALVAVASCKDPVAPSVPNCDDAYSPIACLDGDEVCDHDDRGCRVCSCERDEPVMPIE